jgi:hypothetical protein
VKTGTVLGIDLSIESWSDVSSKGSLAFVFQPRDFVGWVGV